ncbi:hypothetical protein LP417_09810 [Polaromonas sp. P1-6]|nr:hypothetical protein LP417_09810 [Polaromonas sp. P1-6]
MIAEISALNKQILAENGDLVAIKLTPKEIREYPESRPIFGTGWSVDEGSHRWAISSRAEIKIVNSSHESRLINLKLSLSTLKPRVVDVIFNGKSLEKVSLDQSGAAVHTTLRLVSLLPGVNTLLMKTDVSPESPGNGDVRRLSFSLSGMKLYDNKVGYK